MSLELRNAPTDGVTRLAYCPATAQNLLACSSWDKRLRIYDATGNALLFLQERNHPILDCAFGADPCKIVSVGLSRSVEISDLNSQSINVVGQHDQPIKAVCFHQATQLIFTGGWDKRVRAWDPRASSVKPVADAPLSGRCASMDISPDGRRLVLADLTKRTYIFDLRNGPQGLMQPELRDQILKYQLRCIRCFPDNTGFALSSVEGRVAWEYFDEASAKGKKYAFKCHRIKEADGTEIATPVNALAFHPRHGTFATGGSDGGVSVWDGHSKKRLWRLPNFSTSISTIAFNGPGTQLAVGVSYTFESGPPSTTEARTPQVFIRHVKDEDVRPKVPSVTVA